MRTVPLSEAKDNLSKLVDAAETTHEIIAITKHGRQAAVLMAVDDLESLHETLYWLSQPGIREAVAEATDADAPAHSVSSEELRRRLGLPAT